MNDYEKLCGIINEIDGLCSLQKDNTSPQFIAWQSKTERFLAKKYGEKSRELKDFENIYYESGIWDEREQIMACIQGLQQARALLESYLEELEEGESENKVNLAKTSYSSSKIFIVHGHDGELKQEIARLIEKQGIEAVILSEQANQGRTVIEKFENYSDVGGAICLFTADDIGKAKTDSNDKPRARQNVVFETGYFIGKLGRNRVVILSDNGVEMPSDLGGVVYTNSSSWKVDLCKELKAMGFNVDFNKLF